MVRRLTRWGIFLPVVILSVFSPVVKAEPVSGLSVSVYSVDQIPPVISDNAYPICPNSDTHYANIQQGWGAGDVGGCQYQHDRVMLHYSGFITFPEGTESARFIVYSDDGGYINIAGNEFGYWGDRGCSGTASAIYSFSATQSYPIDAWYYENGGGTCFSLYWSLNNGAWSIVPASAFSIQTQPISATSTTSIQETTTVLDTTTSSSTTTSTTTTTTTTIPPDTTTTTTEVTIYTPPQTTTSVYYPDEIVSVPTTLHDFVPEVEETSPETTETTVEESTTTSQDLVEEIPQEEEIVTDTTFVQDTVVEDTIPVSTEETVVIEDIQEEQVLTDEQFDEVVSALSSPDVTPEEIVSIIEELISADLTQEQATELVTNPQVLNAISGEQATELFAEVSAEQLTTEQAEELVAAVQYAPEEVRESFEEELDVFQGAFDSYVPIGSKVSVKERRILNAVTATLFVLSAPVPVTTASASKRS